MWNKLFTFKSNKKITKETIRFLIVCLGQYLINVSIIAVCVNIIGISAEWGGIIAIGVSTFIAFFGHKYWSFKTKTGA
jgi:putative flippase GtrA